jgi:hypothetical protein
VARKSNAPELMRPKPYAHANVVRKSKAIAPMCPAKPPARPKPSARRTVVRSSNALEPVRP